MSVICNKHKTCSWHREDRFGCGGANLHEPCSECRKCPFDETAECHEVSELDIPDNERKLV